VTLTTHGYPDFRSQKGADENDTQQELGHPPSHMTILAEALLRPAQQVTSSGDRRVGARQVTQQSNPTEAAPSFFGAHLPKWGVQPSASGLGAFASLGCCMGRADLARTSCDLGEVG